MNRNQRRLLNLLAFSLLAFSIYLNFFHKDKADNPVNPSLHSQARAGNSAAAGPATTP